MGCCSCLFRNEPKGIKMIEGNQIEDQVTSGKFIVSKLKTATRHLSVENVIGMGGCGVVYKGTLESGEIAAIKFLFHQDGSIQREQEFKNEVEILQILRHPNLVKLYGYASEGNEKFLVYEFVPRGSLADHLEGIGEKQPLDWKTRVNIALGVAKGLQYLHCSACPPVIHRDTNLQTSCWTTSYKLSLETSDLPDAGLLKSWINPTLPQESWDPKTTVHQNI